MKTNKNKKPSLIKLVKYLKPYMALIITAIIFVLISTGFILAGPNRLSQVTDVVQKGLSVNLTLTDEEFSKMCAGESVAKIFEGEGSKIVATFSYAKNPSNLTNVIKADDEVLLNLEIKRGEDVLASGATNFKFGDFESSINNYLEIDVLGGISTSALGGLGLSYDGQLSLWVNTKTHVDVEQIAKICIMLIVLYLIAFVTNYAEDYIMAIVNNDVGKDLRKKIIEKINKLPLKYFDKVQYGDVLSRMVNDVDTITATLENSFTELIGATAQFAGALVMMFATNWIIALSGVVSTFIGFGLMLLIIKKSQRYFIEQQKVLGMVNGVVEESYSGQEIIKAYCAEAQTVKKFDKQNDKLYSTSWRAQFYSGAMHPLMGFVGNLGYVVVCVVGAVLIHYGLVSFAAIVAIMIYIRLFTQPLTQLGSAGAQLQATAAATTRVFELLESEELPSEEGIDKTLTGIKGDVEFKNVKFGYDPKKIIIKDFSVQVKAGQKVAIVGPTGAGKTTLVNLIMKFYDVVDGDILIDGISIKDLKRDNLHSMIGMVLQDTWLFQGTVKENLRFNKQNVSDEQIVQACKACGVDHLIRTLPNGYDTVLDDNTNISAGQKQLLTIARAMVENAPMLILDEATSSVDTRTEQLIQNAMDKLTKNRTSFVIAHRLSTIKNADIILVMKDGDIVEIGNHNSLIKKNGVYADLYNSQFEN